MENTQIGRVIAVHKERYQLSSAEQGEFFARLKAAQYYQDSGEVYPTAGDLVEYCYNPLGDSQILHTLPRKTLFQRYDAFGANRAQTVAANFDTVFILTSANHDFNVKRLRRYLAAARSSGAGYAVILTKIDAADDAGEYLETARREVGDSPVFPISAARGEGLEEIRAYLSPGSVTVFLGSSGVGKSTLVNALAGRLVMDVNGIREDDSKGRHTTTHRQIITLENGAMILDTPGMRELGLTDAEDGVEETFQDIERLTGQCRFRDCTHTREPGCAVQKALGEGSLSPNRWEEYCLLEAESRRRSVAGRTASQKKKKEISKYARQLKQARGGGESGL